MVLMAVGLATRVEAQGCTTPPANVITWLPADGTPDNLGEGPAATLAGDAGYAAGRVSQAFTFDGSGDSVNVPRVPILDPGGQVTLEFWVFVDPTNPMTGCQGLVATDYYATEFCGDQAYFYVNTGSGFRHSSSIAIPKGEWHHVAGTYDGTQELFYLDGVPVLTPTAVTGTILPMLPASFLSIGSQDGRTNCDFCVGTRYFKGMIDEPAVYSRALSASEIQAIVAAGAAGKCKVITDEITVGSAEGPPGTIVHVPVYIRDRSTTVLGMDQAADHHIQGFLVKVAYSPAAAVVAASTTFSLAGIVASLEPLLSQTTRFENTIAHTALFDAATAPVPFTLDAAAPGDQVLTLNLALAPGAASGTVISLTVETGVTALSDQGGEVGETVGAGTLSVFGGAATAFLPPAAELVATAESSSTIRLEWLDQAAETGYRIERSFDLSTWSTLGTVGASVSQFTDATMPPGTLGLYRVVALYGATAAAPSNAAHAVTWPAAPARICQTQLAQPFPPSSVSGPSIAFNGTHWGMVWSENATGARPEIYFRLLDRTTLAPVAPAIRLTQTDAPSGQPSIAWNGSSFGVVWNEGGRLSDGGRASRLFFAKLDANGNKLRGDVRVNLPGQGSSILGGTERFPLVWDGAGWGVFSVDPVLSRVSGDWQYMRLDADGNLLAGPTHVQTSPEQDLYFHPAWNGSAYGMSWLQYSTTTARVLFQRMQVDGTMLGTPVELGSWPTAYSPEGNDVVWDGAGWVATWSVTSDTESVVFIQRLAADGTPQGTPSRLTDTVAPDEEVYDDMPQLYRKPDGGFVVYVRSWVYEPSQRQEIGRLEADAALNRVGSRVLISPQDNLNSVDHRVACDGATCAVVWSDPRTGKAEVTGALVDGAGVVTLAPTDLTAGHSSTSVVPAAVAPLGGGWAALWRSNESGANRIHARFYDATGAVVAEKTPLSSRMTNTLPSALGLGSTLAIAFRDGSNKNVFALFDAAGNDDGGEHEISPGSGSVPALAFSGEVFAMVWGQASQVRLQAFTPDGTLIGQQVVVFGGSAGSGYPTPALAWTGAGWLVTWRAMSGSNLYAAVVAPDGSLTVPPTALTGNGRARGTPLLAPAGDSVAVAWTESVEDGLYTDLRFARLGRNAEVLVAPTPILPSADAEALLSLQWRGDRFALLYSPSLGGLLEVEAMPDGSTPNPPRLVSKERATVAYAAWDGRTEGMLYTGMLFQTTACLDDETPPPCPELTAGVDGTAVNLSWPLPTDPESPVLSTFLYRDGGLLAELYPTTTSFEDTGWLDGHFHSYQVRPMNASYRESTGCTIWSMSRVHGDENGDGTLTVLDIFYLINHLFAGGPPPRGVGDCHGDGQPVNVSDVFYLINYLLAGGPAPV